MQLDNFCSTVFHSGSFWTTERRVNGIPVWPIEEYLIRTKHTPNVAARIKKLNPDGKVEGENPRGWHPSGKFRYEGKRKKQKFKWLNTIPA